MHITGAGHLWVSQ